MSASARRQPTARFDADAGRAGERTRGVLRHHFSALMVDHLIDCLSVFGDLEEMLVMEFVKDKFLRAHLNAAAANAQPNQTLDDSVTASLIAAKTGIPRQTVRRKLFSLARRGWVTQTDDAAWRLTTSKEKATVNKDIASLDRRGLDRLTKLIRAVEPHVNELKRFSSK